MIDYKKIDYKDFVFDNKPLSEKEDKEFSDFLKKRKRRNVRLSYFKRKANQKVNQKL